MGDGFDDEEKQEGERKEVKRWKGKSSLRRQSWEKEGRG